MSRREVKKAPKSARPLPAAEPKTSAKSQHGREGTPAAARKGPDGTSRWEGRSATGAGRGQVLSADSPQSSTSASLGNIGSFANDETRALFHHRGIDGPAPDERVLKSLRKQLPEKLWPVAQRKLDMIAAAQVPRDLMAVRGNRLEINKGTDKQYSIRINEQYRFTFRFESGRFVDVRAWDYHDLFKAF